MTRLTRLFFSLAAAIAAKLRPATIASLARILFSKTKRQVLVAAQDVRGAQAERLRAQITTAKDTAFGKKHRFAEILTADDLVAAFRERVPVQTWDDVGPWVDRMVAGESNILTPEDVFFYATTSGTTGHRKLVPVTSAFVEEARVTLRVLARTSITQIPGAVQGKRLQMRSPGVEELRPGVFAGSITVALAGTIPGADDDESSRGALDALPPAVFEVTDFRSRYFLCLRLAASEDVRLVSAINPSTLLLFAQTLAERAEDIASALEAGNLGPDLDVTPALEARLRPYATKDSAAAERIRTSVATHGHARMQDLFPNLAGLVCWKGGSAPWYVARLPESYGELPVLDYGYAASEGIFGAPLSTDGAASAILPHGHFYEFFHVDDEAFQHPLGLSEIVVGERYEIVVTTGAGLFRYRMFDVIEVVGRTNDIDGAPHLGGGGIPLAVFRQKAGAMASITGEKLGEAHVIAAMERVVREKASPAIEAALVGLCVAPQLPSVDDTDEVPRYVIALDLNPAAKSELSNEDLDAFATVFDRAMQDVNLEYEAKRSSLRLAPAIAARLPPGAIAAYREKRVADGAPDAHVKIPHVSADGDLLLRLGLDESAPDASARLPLRRAAELAS